MRNCEIAAAKAAGSEPEPINAPRPRVISTETLANAQQAKSLAAKRRNYETASLTTKPRNN